MFIITTLSVLLFGYASSQDTWLETDTLFVEQINTDGFGDTNNNYAWAMEEFQGAIYVATLNALNFPGMAAFFLGLPFRSDGVQIWRGIERNNGRFRWTQVLTQGNGNNNTFGIRNLHAVGDYLYAVTVNHVDGFDVWRTSDGLEWEVVVEAGNGDVNNLSGRGIIDYDGYLYIGVENRNSGAQLWRVKLADDGDFEDDSELEVVSDDGIGDTNNWWIGSMAEYQGYLYFGTLNINGMQLFRTTDGETFDKIFDEGYGPIQGITGDTAVMELIVHKDRLYIGTMNFFQGASLWVNTDEYGTNFSTVFTEGFLDRQNAYVWASASYDDKLYLGTFKTSGEFDLYSASEPYVDEQDWNIETTDAFGQPWHYGIRTMMVVNDSLMIGTATARRNEACKVFRAIGFDETEEPTTTEDESLSGLLARYAAEWAV